MAPYWGHNAIIRLAPFIRHCRLPILPGRAPFGGEILSHDFVEAALMQSAGWQVRIAYDLGGSYEECPANLIDYVNRDRRWCQGNLQHMRLVFARGFHPASRVMLATGALSYLTALLWWLFVIVTSFNAGARVATGPEWSRSASAVPAAVLALTVLMLCLPKVFGLFLICRTKAVIAYGGVIRVIASVTLEAVLSALISPILKSFHVKFIVNMLFGSSIGWTTQRRGEERTGWRQAVCLHGYQSILAIVCGGAALLLAQRLFWWLVPVLAGLVVAVPLSVWLSRSDVGLSFKRAGLFLTPEETQPGGVLGLFLTERERADRRHANRTIGSPSKARSNAGVRVGSPAPEHAT